MKLGRQDWSFHLFVKNKVCTSFILFVEEHGPFQAELWNEHDDGVLPHKQDVPFFIKDASALEEQLRKRDGSIVNFINQF